MIRSLKIYNYKSLKRVTVDLANVNINYGLNGMGKSSFNQVLLLVKQSIEQQLFPEQVALNGSCLNLGNGKDIFCESGDDKEGINFEILTEEGGVVLNIRYTPELHDFDVLPVDNEKSKNLEWLRQVEINYLTSERISPQDFFSRSSHHVVRSDTIGFKGEYLAHYLDYRHAHKIPKIRSHPHAQSERLDVNVGLWLTEISPNVRYEVSSDSDSNISTIRFLYSSANQRTRPYKPINTGYGLTNVLPLITLLLTSKPGSVLIIENPELHLHPKGQEALANLITLCSKEGVQVFIETHSTEMVTALSKFSSELNSSYKLNYFHRALNSFDTEVEQHEIVDIDIPDVLKFLSDDNLMKFELTHQLEKAKKPILVVEDEFDAIYKIAYLRLYNINFNPTNLEQVFDTKAPFVIRRAESAGAVRGILQMNNTDGYNDDKVIGLFDYDHAGCENFYLLRKHKKWASEISGDQTTGYYRSRLDHSHFHALLLPIPQRLQHIVSDVKMKVFTSFVEVENLISFDALAKLNCMEDKPIFTTTYQKMKEDKKKKSRELFIQLTAEDFIDFRPLFSKVEKLFGL